MNTSPCLFSAGTGGVGGAENGREVLRRDNLRRLLKTLGGCSYFLS